MSKGPTTMKEKKEGVGATQLYRVYEVKELACLFFIRVGAESNDYDLDNETKPRGEST